MPKVPDVDFITVAAKRQEARGAARWGLPVWAFYDRPEPYLLHAVAAGQDLPRDPEAMPARLPSGAVFGIMASRCAFHVEFADGSNPYFYRGSVHACARELGRMNRKYAFRCVKPMDQEPGGILYLKAEPRRSEP